MKCTLPLPSPLVGAERVRGEGFRLRLYKFFINYSLTAQANIYMIGYEN